MKASAAVFVTAVVACVTISSSTSPRRGMVITAPRTMQKNGVNKMHMHLYDVDGPGTCSFGLQTVDNNTVIAENVVDVEEGERFKEVEIECGETSEYHLALWFNCTFATPDEYTFSERDEVNIRSSQPNIIIFLQTDKPMYKPEQKVLFRCLPVDTDLKPLGDDTQGELWIQDPSGSRMAQWKNVSLAKGIRQFHFLLSNEPPYGWWRLYAKVKEYTQSIRFEVKKYVLPTYDVIIKPPSYVLMGAKDIRIEIIAKYTYGKPVAGHLKINSSMNPYSWSREELPFVEHEDEMDGTYVYHLNVSLVDKDDRYSYRGIKITAEVNETGTGVSMNKSIVIERTSYPLNIAFVGYDYSQQYFKPGMPYYRKVKVTNPDKTPAPNEKCEVCATVTRKRVVKHWWGTRTVKHCRNYTSDEDGLIPFCVPPQRSDTISILLEAKSMNYGTSPYEPGKPRIYQPQTSMSVQPYYSPSRSYIQVEHQDTLQCGASGNIRVLYTAKDEEEYVIHYQIVSKGEVVQMGSEEVTYTSDDDVSKSLCQGSLSVNDVRIPLVPSEEQGGVPDHDDSNCSTRPIGVVDIPIDVMLTSSPAARVLAYYITNNNEVVADSRKFDVEKCFQNKVEFQFRDKEKQPGAKTSITLNASPNSLCGTKVVDKSVILLDASDQLTKEKVFEALSRFDNTETYPRDHCNDKYRQGGKSKMGQSIIFPPRPWSYSEYADAMTACEETGWVCLSDYTFITRPCTSSSDGGYAVGIASDKVGVRGGQSRPSPTRIRPMLTTPKSRGKTMYKHSASADREFSDPGDSDDSEASSTATKSYVSERTEFPETWMFDMKAVGDSGELVYKATLPHTITEWIGSAVCINEEDGLGLSETRSIKGYQAFFVVHTLPYAAIRGEQIYIPISTFNYLTKALAIRLTTTATMISQNGTEGDKTSETHDICVLGGKADVYKHKVRPNTIGSMNITVLAENAEDQSVCEDEETADVVARDMATKSLIVEPEGFPKEKVTSVLICPKDYEDSTYDKEFDINIPDEDDYVEDSARCFAHVTGDLMGPAIENMDRLVQLPTGCGEQNMVRFAPLCALLEYLNATDQLTDAIKSKAIGYLTAGYQNQLKYRHSDGSYSAFGPSDKEGSMWLSAFVVMYFRICRKWISIDEENLQETENWILEKQQADGCYPKVGKVFSQGMQGGVGSQGENSTRPLTAYIVITMIASDYHNETVINPALSCVMNDTKLTPYKAALYAYTFALAEHPEADRYLEWLSQKAIREGDEIYWKNVNGSTSLNLETSAYFILGVLQRHGKQKLDLALSALRHMNKWRNANGGYSSTQDTVVGLEATAKCASLLSKDPIDMTVDLTTEMLKEKLFVTDDNKLIVQKRRVPDFPTNLRAIAQGTGCALFQVIVRYNTLQPSTQNFFSLAIEATRQSNCRKMSVTFCVSYLPDGQRSNMALVEIKLLSGIVAIRDTLQRLVDEKKIEKYEIRNNYIVCYFYELTNKVKCCSFEMEEMFEVEGRKSAPAKVYDYYDNDKETTIDYNVPESC